MLLLAFQQPDELFEKLLKKAISFMQRVSFHRQKFRTKKESSIFEETGF